MEEWGLEELLEDERSRLRRCLEEDERALLARLELWGSAGTADGTRWHSFFLMNSVGNVVGHENIVSASRMNSAIVVFLNDVEKVRKLTQNGIVVNNETILVSPLSSPAKKVMLSNVPPFISDEAIGKELSRYGRMVSPIKKIPLGCFDYNIFVSSDTDIKCFKCGQTGHLAQACPERQSDPGVSERPGRDAAEPAGVVSPAAAVRPAAKGPGAAAAPDLTESEPQAQPAAQKPTGATPAPEKPRTAELAVAEPEWSAEKSSVGSGAVLEPPALTEAGAEVQGNRMETPDTTPVQGDRGDVDMVDEPVFKATGDRGHVEALKSKKAKMNDLLDITAQGALVHSRFKSVAEMDAPFKFFFSLEQKNGQKRFIHAVRTESGDLLSESTEIRKQTVSFYSKLYSSEWSGAQVVEDSFLVGLPKLSE
ncbi:hypothetical protein QTP70_007357 [Hemibagrus guttatus]|uniref:CCHC-type domain-containing protein n=1 Tax=Hemibagrus guttatus TaxID=175788 RepID=A0AAE0RAL0_9TELE|nr:hypothetical protein QTP70_007357 [Hemibagrus guttatus]